jgi:hypothetical protein
MDLGVPPFQETPIFQQDSDPGTILESSGWSCFVNRGFSGIPHRPVCGEVTKCIFYGEIQTFLVLDESLHYTAYYHTYIINIL